MSLLDRTDSRRVPVKQAEDPARVGRMTTALAAAEANLAEQYKAELQRLQTEMEAEKVRAIEEGLRPAREALARAEAALAAEVAGRAQDAAALQEARLARAEIEGRMAAELRRADALEAAQTELQARASGAETVAAAVKAERDAVAGQSAGLLAELAEARKAKPAEAVPEFEFEVKQRSADGSISKAVLRPKVKT